jgi:hypothetical protein
VGSDNENPGSLQKQQLMKEITNYTITATAAFNCDENSDDDDYNDDIFKTTTECVRGYQSDRPLIMGDLYTLWQ